MKSSDFQSKRAPSDRGQGRKSMEGAGQSPVLQVRMTQAQKDKAMRLGGAAWVRGAIDRAREPKS